MNSVFELMRVTSPSVNWRFNGIKITQLGEKKKPRSETTDPLQMPRLKTLGTNHWETGIESIGALLKKRELGKKIGIDAGFEKIL